MPVVSDRPIFTRTFHSSEEFVPDPQSSYIFGTSVEFRGQKTKPWQDAVDEVHLVEIIERDVASFGFSIGGGENWEVSLRSAKQLARFWAAIPTNSAYIDITGLSHSVWAPLVRSGLVAGVELKAVYIEPVAYTYSPNPIQGEIFDLSEKVLGIMPIPGFASLSPVGEQNLFVPLLGFEGTRLAYMVENIEPFGGRIVPVVGVPGFRPEYPFHTYLGNKLVLSETGAWKQTRFAKANCPFSLFYALEDITAAWPEHRLQVAPIGTKPHALGAILFAIANPQSVEIVYDHPVRKASRTQGASRLLVYYLSSLKLS